LTLLTVSNQLWSKLMTEYLFGDCMQKFDSFVLLWNLVEDTWNLYRYWQYSCNQWFMLSLYCVAIISLSKMTVDRNCTMKPQNDSDFKKSWLLILHCIEKNWISQQLEKTQEKLLHKYCLIIAMYHFIHLNGAWLLSINDKLPAL
jgi:hypothetical protein